MDFTKLRRHYLNFYNIDINDYKSPLTGEYDWYGINQAILDNPMNKNLPHIDQEDYFPPMSPGNVPKRLFEPDRDDFLPPKFKNIE